VKRLRGSTGEIPESTAGFPRRRPTGMAVLAMAAVVLLAVGIGLVLAFTGNDGSTPASHAAATTPSSSATSAPASSAAPTSDASQPSSASNPEAPPAALPAVALDATAQVGDGVSATLPRIEEIHGSGTGPGNIAGPAIRVTVRIHNGTSSAVSVDGVAVNMAYGEDMTPASPLDDPSQAPFQGTVAPGKSVDGVYVFRVPSGARDSVTVEVGYKAGAPLLHFTGPVG